MSGRFRKTDAERETVEKYGQRALKPQVLLLAPEVSAGDVHAPWLWVSRRSSSRAITLYLHKSGKEPPQRVRVVWDDHAPGWHRDVRLRRVEE